MVKNRILVMGYNLDKGHLAVYPNSYIYHLHKHSGEETYLLSRGKKDDYEDGRVHHTFSSGYRSFRKKILELNPDVVVFPGTYMNILRLFSLRKIDSKKVLMPCYSDFSLTHALKQPYKTVHYVNKLFKHLLRIKGVSKYIDKVICPTENIYNLVPIEKNKKTIVRPGVSLIKRVGKSNAPKKIDFSYFGDAAKDRGIGDIVKLAGKFPSKHFDLFIRKFEEDVKKRKPEAIEEITKGLKNVRTHIGNIKDVPQKMKDTKIVLAPFRDYYTTEVPNVVLESMSVATPVITTPVNGIPEIVDNGKNGLIYNDRRQLSKFIRNIEDIDVESMGRSAKETIRKKYNMKKNAKKLGEVYETLFN